MIKYGELAEREINIMKRLEHNNVVEFLASTEIGKKTCLVLQLCTHSLDYEIRKSGKGLEDHRIVQLIGDFISGYKHLRFFNIVHHDIKPQNIFFEFWYFFDRKWRPIQNIWFWSGDNGFWTVQKFHLHVALPAIAIRTFTQLFTASIKPYKTVNGWQKLIFGRSGSPFLNQQRNFCHSKD